MNAKLGDRRCCTQSVNSLDLMVLPGRRMQLLGVIWLFIHDSDVDQLSACYSTSSTVDVLEAHAN